jgi:MFS family permease
VTDVPAPPVGGSRPWEIWRNRDFALLQFGQIVSFVGTQVQSIALPLLVLSLTHSSTTAGIILALDTVAFVVVALFAGAMVDRWDRKRTMIVCDTVRALLIGTIPIALWLGHLPIWQVYLVVVAASVFATFFTLANNAALPNVVGQGQLTVAMSQAQAATSFVRLFGALFGGVIYALGRAIPFLANAISFAVSVVSLKFIRVEFQQRRAESRANLRSEIREGVAWMWRSKVLRFLTFVVAGDNLRFTAGYLVIIVLAREAGASSVGVGVVFSGAAVAALAGNLVTPGALRRFSFGRITLTMFWLEALMFPLYAVAPTVLAIAAVAAAESLVNPIYATAFNAYRLEITPDHLRGRIVSATQMISGGAAPLGSVLGGILISSLGAKETAIALGAWLILLALLTTANAGVRAARLESVPA